MGGYAADSHCKVRRFGKVCVAHFRVNLSADGEHYAIAPNVAQMFAAVSSELQPIVSKFSVNPPLLGGGCLNIEYDSGYFKISASVDTEKWENGGYDLNKYKAEFMLPYIIK